MKKNYLINFTIRLVSLLLFSAILLHTSTVIAQCAGQDNTVTICNKEQDASLENFDLFSQLNGTPLTGGTWSSEDPINTSLLNSATGEVNLWLINRFGTHIFTYTNETCNESASVTINLGGYPGEDNIDGGANACSDDSAVNLFTFLDNELTNIRADINGTWEEAPATLTGHLSENIFNAHEAGPGTYTFTYTVDAVDTCLPEFATVVLEVHRSPEAGDDGILIFCQNEDFSPFTNLNLNDFIVGEDANGIWSDGSATGQITSPSDNTINLQEIYDNFGVGDYIFTYTVYPDHGVCDEESSSVTISITNINGQFEINNHCLGAALNINISYTNLLNIPFSHDFELEIRNANNEVIHTEIVDDLAVTTQGQITIDPSPITTPGMYTVSAVNISNVDGLICDSLTIAEGSFVVYNATASIEELCFEGDFVDISIENFLDNTGNPANETIPINYTITHIGSGQSTLVENQEITFSNGIANLPIDISSYPNTSNDYNLVINAPNNNGFECINLNFTASLVPDDIQLSVAIDNQCNATNVVTVIDAPLLSNGEYTVTYEVREVGNPTLLEDLEVVFRGGQVNNQVNITNLNPGNYEIILRSTQNDTHPCRTTFDFEITEYFSIGGIPDAPVLNNSQTFCFDNYTPNGPTINNIVVDQGENLVWYESEDATTPLDIDTVLIDGEDYFVSATNPTNNCQSSDRSIVIVNIITTNTVISNEVNPVFCSSDNATLANLDATAINGTLVWYDSETGGNILDPSTTLINNTSYYAVESVGTCESATRLQFNVTVVTPPTPQFTGSTLMCALDNPTILTLEEQITINEGFELIWYDASENGNEIDSTTLLEEDVVYYVASIDPNTGCESDKITISVVLSECNPEDYDFFIPDGFSPNNDTVNDTYYIPYIEYFYPDYEYEIFNRYGQSMFKGDINQPEWNGKNNGTGNDATSGVYFYVLKYNKNNLKPKQGRIYLSK